MSSQFGDILEADLPIIDAHHHLIDGPAHSYSIKNYLADCQSGHLIKGSVYIEVRQNYWKNGPAKLRPVGETEFVANLKEFEDNNDGRLTPRLCSGIVGFAELEIGDQVEEVLDAHIEAGKGKFRGIRRGVYWSSDPAVYSHVSIKPPSNLMSDENFKKGFSLLAPKKLSFDAVLFHPQLSELRDLAKAFPDTQIILNHVGFRLGVGEYLAKPEETFQEWRRGLQLVAEQANVAVKIGGLGMDIWGFKYPSLKPSYKELAATWKPVVEIAIELFGIDRCIFESNFPVDSANTDFNSLWNAYKLISKDYSDSEKDKLFFSNAQKIYRLSL